MNRALREDRTSAVSYFFNVQVAGLGVGGSRERGAAPAGASNLTSVPWVGGGGARESGVLITAPV